MDNNKGVLKAVCGREKREVRLECTEAPAWRINDWDDEAASIRFHSQQ